MNYYDNIVAKQLQNASVEGMKDVAKSVKHYDNSIVFQFYDNSSIEVNRFNHRSVFLASGYNITNSK